MQCEGFDGSTVFVFGDGPRNETERFSVKATRETARELLGTRAHYRFSDVNRGLSASIISGIDEVLQVHDRVIVIEDDLVLDKWFLKFMNEALDTYASMENVFQISGYMFEAPEINIKHDAVFMPFTVSWGWATWRRAWKAFEPDAPGWQRLLRDPGLRRRFNLDGSYDFSSMLVRQMLGFRDSWAVRWCWSVFGNKGLVLYPPVTMVKNTGFDGSGTHGRGVFRRFSTYGTLHQGLKVVMPKQTKVNPTLYGYVKQALWRQNGRYLGQMIDRLRWMKTSRLANKRLRLNTIPKS